MWRAQRRGQLSWGSHGAEGDREVGDSKSGQHQNWALTREVGGAEQGGDEQE